MKYFVLFFSLITFSACSVSDSQVALSNLETLQNAQSRWNGLGYTSYSFKYQRLCFCHDITPVTITVLNGKVVSVTHEDGSATQNPLDWYPTISEIFSQLKENLAQKPVSYVAQFDRDTGMPTTVQVDISEFIADEEYGLNLSELRPLR